MGERKETDEMGRGIEGEPPAGLPVAENQEGKQEPAAVGEKKESREWLGEDYVELIGDYYKKLFFEGDNLKRVLEENGLSPVEPWAKEMRKLLEADKMARGCLEYALETLSEKYKNRVEELEGIILENKLGEIAEVKIETTRAVLIYYKNALEDISERTKSEKSRAIIKSELEKANGLLVKMSLGADGLEKDKPERELKQEGTDLVDEKEKKLLNKIREAIIEALEEAVGRMRNLTDNQLLLSGIERHELGKEIAEIRKKESVGEVVQECFDALKEKYPGHYWTASNLIKDWADSFIQSEFTVHGSEALRSAYQRAYQFEKGVSKLKRGKLGMTAEELERVFPKQTEDFSLVAKKERKWDEGVVEKVFYREGRMENIRKVIEVILEIHRGLLEESKEWKGYENLTDKERGELVANEYTKPNIVQIYDELLIRGKGFPGGERFRRAFYSYAVSKILEI